MGLKERYLEAVRSSNSSYLKDVGGVLPYTPNETDTGAGRGGAGVNFTDGTKRSQGTSRPADAFQTEFTRNLPESNIIGGAQGTVPSTTDTSYPNSRWTPKALELAFDGTAEGPNTFTQGSYWNTTRFRVARAGETTRNIHNYIPKANYDTISGAAPGGYINKFEFARTRKNASSTSR